MDGEVKDNRRERERERERVIQTKSLSSDMSCQSVPLQIAFTLRCDDADGKMRKAMIFGRKSKLITFRVDSNRNSFLFTECEMQLDFVASYSPRRMQPEGGAIIVDMRKDILL